MTPYYEDEYATIYHGDCREVLPTVSASAEMVVSDPPYGVRYTGGTKEWTAIEGDEDFGAYGFVLPLLKPVDGPLYLFCPDVALPSVVETAGGWLRSVIVWRKPAQYGALSAHYKQANEFLCYMVRPGAKSRWAGITTETTDWEHGRPIKSIHPTEKPLAVCERAIGNHAAGTVLDPFMGSGTTLVAAKNLGRKAIGIEIEERYCEIAAERLSQGVLDLGGAA